ncbi:MAG TPA: hypothetical protein VFA21_08370, partial [Pyrinomonadaceae bacterium]|nr:hypothetical protein [Pyrinomonadaceae bacterium]
MKKFSMLFLAALLCAPASALVARTPQNREQQSRPGAQAAQQTPTTARQERPAGLADYGIEIGPDPRLIVMMAALDAAGWDPTPAGEKPSVFRELLRKDQASLDPVLRKRLQDFYERHALHDVPDNPATPQDESVHYTPADQAARYVSLAYALGQPPNFEAPPPSDDMPAGVLDVLNFVPLLREFYRQSGMDARLDGYVRTHRAAGDSLREPTVEMARLVLAYLNTRPETVAVERVVTTVPQVGKKKEKQIVVPQEHARRFRIVPDLLAAPGAINFRAVGDDYYAVVPPDTDPRLSETRRAYIQFVVDPLVARYNRDVTARRDDIKQLLEHERARTGADLSPDIFLTVSRSLVAAADVRIDATLRDRLLQIETSQKLQQAKDQAAKDAALKESKAREALIEDFETGQLANAYERGAVLAFFFAEQLRGLEGGGFDIANFITPMLAEFKVERESNRPAEYAAAVARSRESRRRALEEARKTAAPADDRRAELLKGLSDVDELLRVHNYEEAEARLKTLHEQYQEEPLVYFALGQEASLSAQDAFDETVQAERLNRALAHFRQAILFAERQPDTDPSIKFRAHLASGRILAHLDRRDEAAKEFDAVIAESAAT